MDSNQSTRNPFYLIADKMERVFEVARNREANSDTAFANLFDNVDAVTSRILCLQLLMECQETAGLLSLPPQRQIQILNFFEEFTKSFVRIMNANKATEISSHLKLATTIEQLRSYGDTLHLGADTTHQIISRSELVEAVNGLISDVENSNLEPYAQRSMILQLHTLTRIAQDSSIYSDRELRLRVKEIFADYCLQVERLDKAHKELTEKFSDFTKKFGGPAVTILSIGANVAGIAGYLGYTPM